jgi:hypothetical protein
MDNISLIPKDRKDQGLPRFVSFKAPQIEFSSLGKIGLILILVISLATGGLYAWKFFLNKKVTNLNTSLQQITGQRDAALESRLENLNTVLEVFKTVLDDHRYWSLFFKVLEEKTLNTITFKAFEGDDTKTSVIMSGSAPSYGALAQQVKILENTQGIASVLASNMELSEIGRVNFDMEITFSKEITRKK